MADTARGQYGKVRIDPITFQQVWNNDNNIDRCHADSVQGFGDMRRLFTVPNFDIFGCICDIQNGALCGHRLFALAFSKTGKYIGKKVRVAIDGRSDSVRPFWPDDNNAGLNSPPSDVFVPDNSLLPNHKNQCHCEGSVARDRGNPGDKGSGVPPDNIIMTGSSRSAQDDIDTLVSKNGANSPPWEGYGKAGGMVKPHI